MRSRINRQALNRWAILTCPSGARGAVAGAVLYPAQEDPHRTDELFLYCAHGSRCGRIVSPPPEEVGHPLIPHTLLREGWGTSREELSVVSFQLSEESRQPSAVSRQPEGGRAWVGERRRSFAGLSVRPPRFCAPCFARHGALCTRVLNDQVHQDAPYGVRPPPFASRRCGAPAENGAPPRPWC
jgi:hypothetical protein